jgi:hypothetical protein
MQNLPNNTFFQYEKATDSPNFREEFDILVCPITEQI